jgi:hypothetical protein
LPVRRGLWAFALVLIPCTANADAGVPLLPFAYPVILVFLIPVIAIEAIYLRARLKTGWRATLTATTKANVVTMLIGYPLAWLSFLALELVFWGGLMVTGIGDRLKWAPGHAISKLIIVAASAAWMGPVEERWAIPFAYVILLIPSFILSGFLESRLMGRNGWLRSASPSARAVWQANALSYAFLAIVGWAALWGFLAWSKL